MVRAVHVSPQISPRQRATIRDVAREAGVAVSTVSNALAGKQHVSETTRLRVLEVAKALDYRASVVAQALRSQQTRTLGVLIADVANPASPDFLRGIDDVAVKEGCTLLLCNTDGSEAKQIEHMRTLLDRQVDGIVLLSQYCDGPEVRRLLEAGTPFVHVQRHDAQKTDDYVGTDNEGSTAELIEHLTGQGHRRIAFVRGPSSSSVVQERVDAFRAALARFGADTDPALIFEGGYGLEGGARAAAHFLPMPDRPTAILASNDMCALGLIGEAEAVGLSVPGDLSIVGYDDIALAGLSRLNLTTIHLPKREMGAAATKLLMKRIRRKRPMPQQTMIFPTRLVIRGTTGPARCTDPPRRARRAASSAAKSGTLV